MNDDLQLPDFENMSDLQRAHGIVTLLLVLVAYLGLIATYMSTDDSLARINALGDFVIETTFIRIPDLLLLLVRPGDAIFGLFLVVCVYLLLRSGNQRRRTR